MNFYFRQKICSKKIEMVFQVFVVQKKQPEHSLKLAIKIKPKKTKMEDIQKIVQFLSEEYKFDADEACEKVKKNQDKLNIPQKKTKAKTEEQTRPKVVLPFCGMVQQNWCQAVRKNYGLYTQCSLPKFKDSLYCKTCAKHAQKNNGVPQNGDVSSLPHPKATNYALIMKKLKITREDAELEASKLGWKIPEEQFVETYKKRGRPKRERRIITMWCEKPLEPRVPDPVPVEETKSEMSEEEYQDELYVEEIIIKGKKYLIDDKTGRLFNAETEEEIDGEYNDETGEIEYL